MNDEAPSTPARHQRDANATRADLLKAARRRFAALGYDRTTTRDIATDAGVNVALIARYFGSKDGLLAAVLSTSPDFFDPPAATTVDGVIEALIAGLDPESWQEFGGEHPLLLLLRDAGRDERVDDLRRTALTRGLDDIVRGAGLDDAPAGEARAHLAVALVVGIALLRGALVDGPLAPAGYDALRPVLAETIEQILTARAES